MWMGVCWQQLPPGPLPGLFAPNLLPVQSVGSDGQLWVLGPCLASACSDRIQAALGGLRLFLASCLVPSPEPLLSSGSVCPVPHRALLRKLGALFLPPEANLSLDSSEGILARAVVQAVSAPSGSVWGPGQGISACCCSGLDTCLCYHPPPPTTPSRLWSSCWSVGSPCSSSWKSSLGPRGLGCQPWARPGWDWWCRRSRWVLSKMLCWCRWPSPMTWFQMHVIHTM